MSLGFLLIAFLSDAAGTVAGFGSSTLFLPFALLFFDFPTALVLVGFAHLFGNLGRVAFFRHGVDRRLLLAFGLPSVLFSFTGAAFVPHLPQGALKAVLGTFLILFAAGSWRDGRVGLKATRTTAVAGGAVSGFLAGLIGTGGAMRGAFLTAFGLEKRRYIATAAAIAILTDVTRIPVYLASGALDRGESSYVPLLLLTSLGGAWIGRRIVDLIPQGTFRRVVLAALAAVGVFFIIGAS